MKPHLFACALFFLIGVVTASVAQTTSATAEESSRPIAIGRWTSRWVRGGLFLDFDHIPLIKGGIVQVFSKDYKKGWYGSGSNPPPVMMETLMDGGRAYTTEYHFSGEGNTFTATQRIEVHPDSSLLMMLKSRWDGAEPALLEWNPARLWAYPLLGAEYEAESADGSPTAANSKSSGRVPLRALPASAIKNRIAADWKSLILHLPALGDLSVTATNSFPAASGPVLLDGRSDPYLQHDRLMWLGYTGPEMTPGQDNTASFNLTLFPKAPQPLTLPVASAPELIRTRVIAVKDALSAPIPLNDSAGHPIIIPQPKCAAFPPGDYLLKGRLPLTIALPQDEPGRRASQAANEFVQEISDQTPVRWSAHPGPWKQKGLLVTTQDALPSQSPLTPSLTQEPEGYALIVTPQFVAVVGRDAAGAFYGLQTLRQLLRVEPDKSARFVGAEITDWPSLQMRAAHIYVGKDALPFHKKLIERIFSRYKLNTMVIECEYTRWKSHPEIAQPFSMSPDDLKQDVAFARDHFMELIPLVASLGHSEWIFKNGQHLDLAEDVQSPHAYDASNPDSYRFIFDIFGEALDIFHPRYFHIGHDEVKVPSYDTFGKYPARPQNIAKGVTALFMEDTNRLSDWLRERGAKPILWADMLLHESEGDPAAFPSLLAANAPSVEEAEKRRSMLPADAVIADWRYEPGSEQRNGLAIFRALGHDFLGCAWFSPENIRGWALQAIENKALGTLQTTWAGYDSRERLLEEEYKQFTAFVYAAEYAWSGTTLHPRPQTGVSGYGAPPSGILPYDAADIFARSYRSGQIIASPHPGWYLRMDRAVNIAVSNGSDLSGFLTGTRSDESAQAGASDRRPMTRVQASPDVGIWLAGSQAEGIMLNGALIPSYLNLKATAFPSSVILPVGAKAGTLAFTHAVLAGLETGAQAAHYDIVFADGQRMTIPLRSGQEICALDDGTTPPAFSSTRLTVGPPEAGSDLRLFRWTNPRPDVVIERIEFHTDNPLASPILFGITGLK